MTVAHAGAAVRTTCPYCGVGCGLWVQADTDCVRISGDPGHPANFGRLCVKGASLGETLSTHRRLLSPMIRASRTSSPVVVSWDAAIATVAQRFNDIRQRHGPDSVAFYVSGQMLTEDYYVANKLMKGFIGSANIDTNSRLCMSSAVAGHRRAFGEDWVPVSYTDVEQADLLVITGSNLAWCHPVLFQRIVAARAQRPQMRVVVIDPRRTATCDIADLHLPLRADTDVRLWNRLLGHLASTGAGDGYSCPGSVEAVAATGQECRETVADACGISVAALAQFEDWFAGTDRVVTLFSQGVNQSTSGTDKVSAIINCHLFTGRIDRPGAGPFSITGQPNAMGGREVGGLSNQLAAHLTLEDPAHRALVADHWGVPTVAARPGLKAVELFDALHRGEVKAVWIMATNPLVSLPDADHARAALARAEFVVVSEAVAATDTLACADVGLPATTWGERDGTVTNSERIISRQRPFRPAPGEAKPDWWIISRVAAAMGWQAPFDYQAPGQIFDEYARLTARDNRPGGAPRRLHLGGLVGLSPTTYDQLPPTRWPVLPSGVLPDDGQWPAYRMVPTPAPPSRSLTDEDFPLMLNTGRVRDQWHTMSRTGLSPTLSAHWSEPTLDLHPQDALAHGIADGALARVNSRWGRVVVRARSADTQRRGEVFVPIHWNGQTASDARIGCVVSPDVDPESGEPAFKQTAVRVELFAVRWQGFAFRRSEPDSLPFDWWVRVEGRAHLRFELAGREPTEAAWARVAEWLTPAGPSERIELRDVAAGRYRAAWFVEGQLQACCFLSMTQDLPDRSWLTGVFAGEAPVPGRRFQLLAGAPARASAAGPIVCACFRVGRTALAEAVAEGCTTPQAITARTRAGGNCGSCLPEIRELIAAAAASAAKP